MSGARRCPRHGFPIANRDIWWCGCAREHTIIGQIDRWGREQTTLYGPLRPCVRCGHHGRSFAANHFCPRCVRWQSEAEDSRPFMLGRVRGVARDHRLTLVMLGWAAVLWWLAVGGACESALPAGPEEPGPVQLSSWTIGSVVGSIFNRGGELFDLRTEPLHFECRAQSVTRESFDRLLLESGGGGLIGTEGATQNVEGAGCNLFPVVELRRRGRAFVAPVEGWSAAGAHQRGFFCFEAPLFTFDLPLDAPAGGEDCRHVDGAWRGVGEIDREWCSGGNASGSSKLIEHHLFHAVDGVSDLLRDSGHVVLQCFQRTTGHVHVGGLGRVGIGKVAANSASHGGISFGGGLWETSAARLPRAALIGRVHGSPALERMLARPDGAAHAVPALANSPELQTAHAARRERQHFGPAVVGLDGDGRDAEGLAWTGPARSHFAFAPHAAAVSPRNAGAAVASIGARGQRPIAPDTGADRFASGHARSTRHAGWWCGASNAGVGLELMRAARAGGGVRVVDGRALAALGTPFRAKRGEWVSGLRWTRALDRIHGSGSSDFCGGLLAPASTATIDAGSLPVLERGYADDRCVASDAHVRFTGFWLTHQDPGDLGNRVRAVVTSGKRTQLFASAGVDAFAFLGGEARLPVGVEGFGFGRWCLGALPVHAGGVARRAPACAPTCTPGGGARQRGAWAAWRGSRAGAATASSTRRLQTAKPSRASSARSAHLSRSVATGGPEW